MAIKDLKIGQPLEDIILGQTDFEVSNDGCSVVSYSIDLIQEVWTRDALVKRLKAYKAEVIKLEDHLAAIENASKTE